MLFKLVSVPRALLIFSTHTVCLETNGHKVTNYLNLETRRISLSCPSKVGWGLRAPRWCRKTGQTISIAGCSLPNEAIWKITSVLLNPKHTGLTARLLSNQCVYSEKLIISFLQREAWDISLSQLSKTRPAFKGLQVRCQYCKLSSRVFSYSALLKGSGAKW